MTQQITKRIRDVLGTAAARIWGTTEASPRGVELTAEQVRTIADVYSIGEVDAAIDAIELTPGPAGATGPAGPNVVDGSTSTTLVGLLQGDGSNVGTVTIGSGLSYSGGTLSTSATGSIGGSTGATDNRVLRADGAGGSTVQSSLVSIDDTGTIETPVDIRFGTTSGSVAAGRLAHESNATFLERLAGNFLDIRYSSGTLYRMTGSGHEFYGGTLNVYPVLRCHSTLRLHNFTAATLPSAAASVRHIAVVTDSSVTTFGSVVAGGGANNVMVRSNGTNWTVCGI
jgi:hypothetical protein